MFLTSDEPHHHSGHHRLDRALIESCELLDRTESWLARLSHERLHIAVQLTLVLVDSSANVLDLF